MACNVTLRTDLLPNAEPGGTWTYDGMTANSTNAPTGSPTTLSGDNPTIDTTTYPSGWLWFTYSAVDNCSNPVSLQANFYKAPATDAGQDGTTSHCANETQVLTLRDFLQGTAQTSLTFTSTGNTPPANSFNPQNGTFDLSQVNSAGTFIFQASAFPNTPTGYPASDNCDNCDPKTATVTVTVSAAADAGNPTQVTVCDDETSNINSLHLANNPGLSGLTYSFFGYRPGSSGVYGSGTFGINGAAATSHGANTDIPSPFQVSNFGANGQYLFLVNAGSTPCQDSSTVQLTVETCTDPCSVTASASYSTGSDVLIGSQSGCNGTPSFFWQQLNGSTWQNVPGQTNATYPNPPNGTYRFRVLCGDGNGCSDNSNVIVIDNADPCNVSVTISENSNGFLLSNVSGCGGSAINYTWQYNNPANGQWTTVGSGSSHNPQFTATYRLIVNCGSCSAISNFVQHTAQDPCSFSVSISENTNAQTLTATTSNCSGTATYNWQYSPTGSGWTNTGQTSQTITPNNGNGFYRVIVQCSENGQTCPNSATYNYTAPPCGLDCDGDFTVRFMSEPEDHDWIIFNISQNVPVQMYLISFKVDGVDILSNPQTLIMDGNTTIWTAGGNQFLRAITDWLDTFGNPHGIYFDSWGFFNYTNPTACGFRMRVQYPSCKTFELEFERNFATDEENDPCIITQDGMIYLTTANDTSGQNFISDGCSDYLANRFPGFYDQSTGNDC